MTQTNIFISYARRDARELAIKLRDSLSSAGYSIWLDLEEIPGGASWSENIEAAIEHCHIMLALMSDGAYGSQWCRAEQLRALRKGKSLIPLLVEQNAEVPLHMEHLNFLDFSDASRYNVMLRDLLSDLNAGQAFRQTQAPTEAGKSPFKQTKKRKRRRVTAPDKEKRNAPALRRHIRALHSEYDDARRWWSYFLFHATDIHTVAEVLKTGTLKSHVGQGKKPASKWDNYVPFYFRPRTPDLYHAEGFHPATQTIQDNTLPIPVYLMFDLETLICHPESRFSDGDPLQTKKTYVSPAYFRELPFEQIYHDSWFSSDEREEIMRHREAQVIIPDEVRLPALQLIWLRSEAEYETLRSLLGDDLWRQWHDKVSCRQDYHVFNQHRAFIQQVDLLPQQIQLRFNIPQQVNNRSLFVLSIQAEH
ncbi:MAG: DarT ssDNA thymidine ADP-ribosyltransferase family protein, partial [Aggregatilineales bacterium]